MKNRIIAFIFTATALIAPTFAQTAQLPAPSPIEKELAARASDVSEVTLDKNTLAFASSFMNGKDKDKAATKQLIDGLEGIYVRDYEFDKEGQFTTEQIEQLRKYYESAEWSSIVRERDRKTGESTDVMVKMANGKTVGMFILDVEPKEVSIVLILGPIRMEDLNKLKNISGLDSALGGVEFKTKDKDKNGGDGDNKEKMEKDKARKDGNQ